MKRIRTFASVAAVAAAFCFVMPAFAQDDIGGSSDESSEESVSDEGQERPKDEIATLAQAATNKNDKFFYPLIKCLRLESGKVKVRRPRATEWKDVEEGLFYPLGSTFRAMTEVVDKKTTRPPRVRFAFGLDSWLVITNDAEFATLEIAIGEKKRTFVPISGRFDLNLPRILKDGMFGVLTPHFKLENLAGESRIDYWKRADGDEAVVRVVTGSMSLEGAHYRVERMGVANRVRIRTSEDDLFSSLRGESGDVPVILDQGQEVEKNFETGEEKPVDRSLEFLLSPQCAIKFHRAKSKVGGRMVVTTMTFDPSGELKNFRSFAEKRFNVNTGEMVVDEKKAKEDAERMEREAAEATAAAEGGGAEKSSDSAGEEGASE